MKCVSTGSSSRFQTELACACLALWIGLLAGCGSKDPKPPINLNTIERAERLFESRRFDKAREVVTELLVADPDDPRLLILAANLEAEQGDLKAAVELIDGIARDEAGLYAAALGQSATWLVRLQRWEEAERRFNRLLELSPDATMAHRQLAELFNRQGRRQESAQQIRKLCAFGDVTDVELHSVLSVPVAFYDRSSADPDQLPIGALGKARIAFAEADLQQAVKLIDDVSAERSLSAAENAFLGRALMVSQSIERMPGWLASCDDQVRLHGDFWFAVGSWMAWEDQPQRAVSALAQAIRIEPTDRAAYRRLAETLARIGNDQAAQWCLDRSSQLDQTFELAYQVGSSRGADVQQVGALADSIEALDRPLEALAWRMIAAQYAGADAGQLSAIALRRQDVRQATISPDVHLPPSLRRTDQGEPSFDWLANLARDNGDSPATESTTINRGIARFQNVAADVGLDGRYLNEETSTEDLFLLHTGVGGGVAVVDFDLDGRPDLYFPQGGCKPNFQNLNQWNGQEPNLLYRNLGAKFRNVTDLAAADDRGYGQGATAGDFNADGFVDLLVANIGHNTLLINNGDGTFRDASHLVRTASSYWTTSVAIADVNGDHLADVIESNYVDDPEVYRDPWAGRDADDPSLPPHKMPRPLEFRAAPDRVFLNSDNGSTTTHTLNVKQGAEFGSGLALVVTDIDNQGGNEILVANDMRPNHFWRRTVTDQESFVMTDSANVAGCAYSSRGNATACMGIAAADFDNNQRIDFAITNFYDEPMCFYQQTSAGVFVDTAARVNLFEIGYDVNSFGTQAIDYDNNGRTDLVVVNGHIYDSRQFGVPFQMPPQLIDGSGQRFQLVNNVDDPSGYWSKASLARAVATLDWNQDGRLDLAITHLDLPHALIENQSEQTGNWLQLRLVGTKSERDAIGARIRVVAGERVWFNTLNSGDGFECKNESIVCFGLGDLQSIDHIEVVWPAGDKQSFQVGPVNRRLLLIEGHQDCFDLPPPP